MKNFLFAIFIFFSGLVFSQNKVIIEYRQTNVDNPERVKQFELEMKQKLQGNFSTGVSRDFYYKLEYNDGISSYAVLETINNDQNSAGGAGFSIHVGGEYKTLIGNHASKQFQQEVKLDDVNYLVTSPFKDYEWKITKEESKILDYKVIKAISEKEGIVAWYTTDLKPNIGPNHINGLPGTILKSETLLKNKFETKITYEAVKVDLNPKKFTKIKDIKGKEVTNEEFKQLREESKQKMLKKFSEEGVDKK